MNKDISNAVPSEPTSGSAVAGDLVAQLKADYARFPEQQSYELYADDVQFRDPLNQFRGVDRYRQMIGFLSWFFRDIQMDLHGIERPRQTLITTQWTLWMRPPLPFAKRIAITGRSELGVNADGLIVSHIDYWDEPPLSVLKQVWEGAPSE